jgi:hypothetical protein
MRWPWPTGGCCAIKNKTIFITQIIQTFLVCTKCKIITDVLAFLYKLILDKANGIAVPLQAWTGRKGCRRLRFPHLKIIGT